MKNEKLNKNKWIAALAAGLYLSACGGAATDAASPLQPSTNTAPALKFGQVTLTSSETKMAGISMGSGSASAVFSSATGDPALAASGSCKTEQKSGCTVIRCEVSKPSTGTGTGNGTTTKTPETVSAGVIDIQGTLKSIQLNPEGKTYKPYSSTDKLWAGGETINVTAKGADVPAFKLSAPAPAIVTLTSPTWTLGSSLSVTKSKALELAWKDGKSGDVTVQLTGSNDTNSTNISCKFAASAGKGSIAPDVLALIPATPKNAALLVNGTGESKTTAGGYEVNLKLYAPATTASGPATTQVTFK